MTAATIQAQALQNALTSDSTANYRAILTGFAAMDIPLDQIRPRENVFTFAAWKALGRHVRKGQHGVRISTVLAKTREDGTVDKMPLTTHVFHVSQTEPSTVAEPVTA